MKKIILALVAVLMSISFTVVESIAEPKKKSVTVEFLTDIDCDHCAKKIMNYMPFQKGIKEVEVDLESKVVTISYDEKKSSNDAIIKLFKKIDIEATVAEEDEAINSVEN